MDLDVLKGLAEASGADPAQVHTVVARLAEGAWWTQPDLIRETATPRRTVEALLREIAPERAGDRFRLTGEQVASYRKALDETRLLAPPADPVAHLLAEHAEVLDRLEDLVAGGPRARQALDHVAATPETVLRRALLLGARFHLPGSHVLCVGDHDLTSLAIAMIHPETPVTVVDIDERILAYIGEQAERLGLDVRTRWADLRLGLPASVHGEADLAITDPPYTPEGVGLFVGRGVEGLRDPDRGRVLLAYGASDRTPMLALKVQRQLQDLNLVYEAIYPDFNRYFGAEAIGSAADLYVLRPTSKTRPAVAAQVERIGTAIYTHGAQSVEARSETEVAESALTGFEPGLLVGDWPKDLLPKVPRVRPSTWLAKPYAAAQSQVAVLVPAGMEAALPRLLLAARADRVRVITAAPLGGGLPGLAGPLFPVYDLTSSGTTIDAVRKPFPEEQAERIVRQILDKAHGKVLNTWREALIRANGDLTKRQARDVILSRAPWAEGCTPLELPGHRLEQLPAVVNASLGDG